MSSYAHPEALVDTEWVADHLNDSKIRLLEVGWGTSEYESGHIPGAIGWGLADLYQRNSPEIADKQQIEAMLSQAGMTNSHTIVLYGGLSNLVAALAFWMLKLFGHRDLRLLDGGRQKWIAEDRALTTDTPPVKIMPYIAQEPNRELRADKELIAGIIGQPGYTIVDARSVDMYDGKNTGGMQHGGHIPLAVNVPAELVTDAKGNFQRWQTPTTHEDGTFKPAEELQALFAERAVSPNDTVVTYCLRGGLSSHMWFVLTQLLGYPHVREYDRSWAEWGNLKDAPIEI